MCEQLGTNPYDGEVPIDFGELCHQSQDALTLFEYCTDRWDTMNGSYLGKDLTNISFLLSMLSIDEPNWITVVDLLNVIIPYRVDSVNKKMKTKAKMSGVKNGK
ncbi:MAG: hypothetical protein GY707_05190 [Desulfobacteraceae bacterium]|nr:hypothetical protein [Desulfobacteraceae bacterium]